MRYITLLFELFGWFFATLIILVVGGMIIMVAYEITLGDKRTRLQIEELIKKYHVKAFAYSLLGFVMGCTWHLYNG